MSQIEQEANEVETRKYAKIVRGLLSDFVDDRRVEATKKEMCSARIKKRASQKLL